MNPNTLTNEALDRLLAKQRARTEAAEKLLAIAREFPELIAELLTLHAHPNETGGAAEPSAREGIGGRRTKKGSAFSRIVRLFFENNNEWIDTGTITSKASVSRNVAATVLWSSHKDDFEQRPHEHHAKMKVWRLRPERIDPLRKQLPLFASPQK
jgi:hypothetical protein